MSLHAVRVSAAAFGAAALLAGSWAGTAQAAPAQPWVSGAKICHASSLNPATSRPDPKCQPGATNPAVTQATIHKTICVPGYSKKIRPPVSYTNALKRQQIKEYGYRNTSPSAYEEDHLIPLSLGGAPRDPKNLWPEPGGSPNPKDSIEFKLYKAVCSGKVTLRAAQKAIATNWTTAGRLLGRH
ncbi:hypothetical protein [Actinomadura rupiterrae]|uniref:hypothetical protein n=1 Tax=Actinomadura rupiterrae TaxID=559627 RepID=UPI0020A3F36F|nr:hypothetical protein [Actinomadura rupiterrae]MCP2339441.1 hypothetical protein [Actinomadura rupiterrae]